MQAMHHEIECECIANETRNDTPHVACIAISDRIGFVQSTHAKCLQCGFTAPVQERLEGNCCNIG